MLHGEKIWRDMMWLDEDFVNCILAASAADNDGADKDEDDDDDDAYDATDDDDDNDDDAADDYVNKDDKDTDDKLMSISTTMTTTLKAKLMTSKIEVEIEHKSYAILFDRSG